MKKVLLILLVSFVAIYSFSGCSTKNKQEKSAQELANDGVEYFEDEDYTKAIESFERLRDWYPFSKLAILAEFKIAESYYLLEEYDEAIYAYEEFERLHPRNEAIPYIAYQVGICYFEQIDTIDRDQSSTQKALNQFRNVKKRFPDSEYAKKSEEKITACIKSLAGHELYVARFYFKAKHYKGALARYESVISNYPDVGFHEEAKEYIELCKKKLQEQKDLEKQKK
jgi:outer membrane protein assembly factor BamD